MSSWFFIECVNWRRQKSGQNTVLDLVMIAPIQLQCIFSYTILANPEVEPHAPNTHQSKLLPSGSINRNKCSFLFYSVMNNNAILVARKNFSPLFGMNSLLPNWNTLQQLFVAQKLCLVSSSCNFHQSGTLHFNATYGWSHKIATFCTLR